MDWLNFAKFSTFYAFEKTRNFSRRLNISSGLLWDLTAAILHPLETALCKNFTNVKAHFTFIAPNYILFKLLQFSPLSKYTSAEINLYYTDMHEKCTLIIANDDSLTLRGILFHAFAARYRVECTTKRESQFFETKINFNFTNWERIKAKISQIRLSLRY